MMSLMVLAICTLPPLAIFVVAVTGLHTGQFLIALPLIVSAGVLLVPLLSPVFQVDEQVPSLRFVALTQPAVTYAFLHPSR